MYIVEIHKDHFSTDVNSMLVKTDQLNNTTNNHRVKVFRKPDYAINSIVLTLFR